MKKIKNFFKGVKKEAKTVRWPDAKTTVKYSCITVVMLVFFGVYFLGLDALFTVLKEGIAYLKGLL